MAEEGNPIPRWQRQDLPPTLSQRFEFDSYTETRRFLDGVAKLADEAQHYPNLSFGKTYVSVTLDADGKKLTPDIVALAQKIDLLVATAD
ncbi:MAG: 4a-hydroxytetrahydrobiopterin dehydratase [Thiobacillus sp.]|nr:4a-hydroxytetrahydrobiopterin dehydratase [Thiobacillus sp.]